ncbi:hypothetical protein F511_27617 [Dorcoceras hygrometricum]|uniref:Uncharacterized protein n=1 Tax=Dorcoceras hygrometricum TaxID=472368 RepID=A0A2Z7CUV1_9LAMI|nr:hypothetical protein F511_27617 [Dorcoceras hygrometricum]
MSSPSTTPVSSTAASIDSVPVSPETKEPWLPDQAELGSSQPPWYEEKSSNLRRATRSLPVRDWAYVPSWSGFCVEELREFASAELGFCAELVGLICLRRRATRSLPVRDWAYVPSWSGLYVCVGELREVCQCGTGLMCLARVVARGA